MRKIHCVAQKEVIFCLRIFLSLSGANKSHTNGVILLFAAPMASLCCLPHQWRHSVVFVFIVVVYYFAFRLCFTYNCRNFAELMVQWENFNMIVRCYPRSFVSKHGTTWAV